MGINKYNVPINIVISIDASNYDEAENMALDLLNTSIDDNEYIKYCSR